MDETPHGASPATDEAGHQHFLVVVAHPDDAEFVCGASMATWSDAGHRVTLCVITDGGSGSDDPSIDSCTLAELRVHEQRAAADILGIGDVIGLGFQDGMLFDDADLRRALTRVMRQVRPDVVVSGDPSVYWVGTEYINHPDHRAAALATLAAVFPASGNRHCFPELLGEGLEPHKIRTVYLSSPNEPNYFVDISGTIDRKIAALRAHVSQMGDWDPEESVREWAREAGKLHDPPLPYAETFRVFSISG